MPRREASGCARFSSLAQSRRLISTPTEELVTEEKHARPSPACVPISTSARPRKRSANRLCTACGDRIGLASTGSDTSCAQSRRILQPSVGCGERCLAECALCASCARRARAPVYPLSPLSELGEIQANDSPFAARERPDASRTGCLVGSALPHRPCLPGPRAASSVRPRRPCYRATSTALKLWTNCGLADKRSLCQLAEAALLRTSAADAAGKPVSHCARPPDPQQSQPIPRARPAR